MNSRCCQKVNSVAYLSGYLLGCLLLSFTAMANERDTESIGSAKCPVNNVNKSVQFKKDSLSIEKVLAEWKAAVQVADLTKLGSLVTDDAEFWTHGAEPLVGRADLINAFASFLEQYEMQQNYECKELIITEDWAFIRGLEVNKLKHRTSHETTTSLQHAFSLLQKNKQGHWRFARGMTNRPPIEKPEVKK